MIRTRPSAAVVAAVAVLVPMFVVGAASAGSAPYSAARSVPRTDPYYPGQGDPSVDALHYDLDVSWNDVAKRLTGSATIVFRAPQDEKAIRLDLGKPLTVLTARLDGSTVGVDHHGDRLDVATGPLARGSRHTLVVRYAGHPKPTDAPVTRSDFSTVGWTTQSNGQVWTMQEPWGALTWFPVNDHPSDKAYYDLTVHTRPDWRGVANGRLRSNAVAGGVRTMRWHLASPAASYLVTIAIGPYRLHRDTGPHGLPLTYWVRETDRSTLHPLRRTPRMLRWLEHRLGPYPFDRAGAVVVPSRSAMETQTLVTMGNGVLSPYYGAGDLLHEYAHQWYGDSVTPNNWKDLWLNEGFAMYLQIRWEVAHGQSTMRAWRHYLARTDQRWRDDYGPPGRYDRGSWGSINVYYCSALMLDRLRMKIGAGKFAKVMRGWPQQHRFADVDRHDWVDWLDATTGRDLDHFVHRWLMSYESPA
jgi:aminopeptidase N